MSIFHKMRPQWQQTMLRVKDPKASIAYYKDNFKFTLIDEYHFPKMGFSLYFLSTMADRYALTPGTDEAHDFLWNFKGVTIELTHNHGSDDFKANSGNEEPNRGFGHIAVLCDDVYKSCEELEKNGVAFKKKPDEGRMKGLAFAYDPDGYWVEIVKRTENSGLTTPFNLAQTMLRVKDANKTVAFYEKYFGMTLLRVSNQGDFSLYFLASLTEDEKAKAPSPTSEEARAFVNSRHDPVLELTHNHGTEEKEGQVYHNGNTEPKGFGHIGFLVDDIEVFCQALEKDGVSFQKKLTDGSMKMLAFALDPDNYWIEIIPRGMKMPKEFTSA
ncbi:Lactoylglutathione lyase [Diplonema papillatum]|nr:Lactoylglutathione lyase [Diplonema papillatum]